MTNTSSSPQPAVLRAQGFDAFYRAYHARIVRYFDRRLDGGDLPLDLAHETFASAFKARETFRGSAAQQEQAWLWAIARNQLRGHLRSKHCSTLPGGRRDHAPTSRIGEDGRRRVMAGQLSPGSSARTRAPLPL